MSMSPYFVFLNEWEVCLLDEYSKLQQEAVIAITKRFSRKVGSIVLRGNEENLFCVVSALDGHLIRQFLYTGMNRSGIRKLRKRIFERHTVIDVSEPGLVDSISASSQGSHDSDLFFLTANGHETTAVMSVRFARKLEYMMYVRQRAAREYFFRRTK
ncbi:hypothetical protein DS901_09055 [Loktanella sp. D2R18]|uniref:hypothetical protein n=1 Tax=Rhodobacterales TaxID=204455 RepID=UPI000DE8B671|nr:MULTISPECIES: hypothetical protein [Rhodobacterales]MDO6591496.1 hypothetical protein [Yoonia sp. 1_MG-2023]RBW43868.1 hypothetical protein DS901_09055 [Loktanella sp. D2R18]